MEQLTGKLILFVLLMPFARLSFAVDPFLNWQTLHSENFQVHFAEQNRAHALRTAKIAEAVHDRLSKELNWIPKEKTHLVLSDETDFANGFATVININRSVLFLAPPTGVGGLEDFDDWLNLLITHEYTHVLHLDKVERLPAGFRNFFGRFLLTFPNVFEPTWIIEGLATYKETDHERGIGRGQSTLFASMMRMEVAAGIKPVSQVNLPITTWPSGATRYLYGVYFFEFIRDTYGDEKVQQLVDRYSGNLIPFALNTTFKRIFDKDVYAMWHQYGHWLEKKFSAQLEGIREAGVVAGERISETAYRTGPVRAMNGTLYYVEDDGASQATLVKHIDGKKTALTEVTSAGFDVASNGDVLISQIDFCDEHSLYSDLYIYDESEQALEQLTECGRYVRAVWHPEGNSIYALQHEAGRFALLQLDWDAVVKNRLIEFEPGTIVGWFDVSPDADEMVFALWKPDLGWNLHTYDLESGEWQILTNDDDIQSYPEYTPDGKRIVYSADHDGTFNLYRYDREQGSHTQLSRTVGGAFQSSSDADGIYYIGYTAEGTDVFHLETVRELSGVKPGESEHFRPYDYDDVTFEQTDYSPWSALSPKWWFPGFVLTDDVTEITINTAGNDALGIHNYFASAGYDFSNSVPSADFVYSYSDFFSFAVSRDNNTFRNTAGQLNRVRSEDAIQFVFSLPDSGLLSSSRLLLALRWENNFDNRLFNNAMPANDFSDNLLGLAWLYNSSRIYPLSISPNDGREIRLVAEDGDALNSDLSGQVYTASWQEYFRLGGEHVLAIRALQGWGEGVTSSFLLGGEDSGVSYNIFLQRSGVGLFGRRDYALRGYAEGLPQLRGQRAQILSAEWRFPGQRIERGIMAPPIGIMQWSGAVFAETGAAYDTDSPDRYYSSAGLELTADLNLFYLVPVRARLGVAHGFDENIGDTRAYLSLGASF